MSKVVLLLVAGLFLAGCSRSDRETTRVDAEKLGQDLKHEAIKADAAVTKEMKEARDHIKRDVEKAKQ